MPPKVQFPPAFQARLKNIIPPGMQSQVMRAYEEGQPICGRINALKADFNRVKRLLAEERIDIEAVEGLPQAFTVIKGGFKKLTESPAYEEGLIYLQSLSSQIPPLVLNPQPGERVLDMCAAPGGKTTQMAALMQNQGEILACETDQRRFERLEANVKRQGALIVQCKKLDARKLNPERNGLFDRILLDAPCSSEGTFSLKDPSTFSHWSEDFVVEISQTQRQLLEVAATLLKPGGTLVYSTCALSPEENEGVLNQASPSLQLIDIPLKILFLKGALSGWKGQSFSSTIMKARRIYPSDKTEGFFMGLLQKK